MSEHIIDTNVKEQYEKDSRKYAIYVSRDRITADYRDGLKPIHRKILYSMFKQGYTSPNKKKKSANVVGDVIAKYSPHGTDSTYGAIANMAVWFKSKMPLIYPEGNWGSLLGDKAAAMRYTECSLNYFAMDCVLRDLSTNPNAVDWIANYDETTTEPLFLAPSVPLLLINGTMGIGVGLKTDIPRHNLGEVIDATLALINNPNIDIVLIPDLCMPCNLIDTDWAAISRNGFGQFEVMGKIEETTYDGYPALVIKSLPDYTSLDSISEKIEGLIANKSVLSIRNTYDKTDHSHVEFYIQLKQGADVGYVKDMIYKHTGMKSTCRVNFEVLDGMTLQRMSYKDYLLKFIEFRKLTKFRLHCNEVQNYKTKFHELDAMIKVMESGEIDFIYDTIRHRKDTDDTALVEHLIKKVGLTDLQAQFIINTNFKKLSLGYYNKYKEEAARLMNAINDLMNKITNDKFIEAEIVEELMDIKARYSSPRICRVIKASVAADIPKGDFVLIVTPNNFIKKIPVEVSDLLSFKDDGIRCITGMPNDNTALMFDEKGKVFRMDVHKVPLTPKNKSGTDLRLINKNMGSNVMKIFSKEELEKYCNSRVKLYFVIVTRGGYCKKIDIEDCIAAPNSGIFYIKLEQDDTVQEILLLRDEDNVMVYSDKKAIKMSVSTIPYLKRATRGSRAMANATLIDGMSYIDDRGEVIVVTENGYINRVPAIAVPLSTRGGNGANVIKLGRTDKVKSILSASPADLLRLRTIKASSMDIPISEIPAGSTVGTGTKMLPGRGDQILNVSLIKG